MLPRKRLLTILGFLAIAVAIPVTLFVAQQRQTLESGAFSECPLPMDIVLVVDTSTSMSRFPETGEKKIDGAINATQTFLNNSLIDSDPSDSTFDSDRIGLVSFNKEASLVQGLTNNKPSVQSGVSLLKDTVNEGTRIHKGIELAAQELNNNGIEGREKIMVVLTDGLINPSPDEFREACQGQYPVTDPSKCEDFNEKFLFPVSDAAKASGINIFTIGFGQLEGVDTGSVDVSTVFRQVLERVASTPGQYYYAPDNGSLEGVFQTLASLTHTCECTYESILEIRDADTDEVLQDIIGFTTESTVTSLDGEVTGPIEIDLLDPETGEVASYYLTANLPDSLKSVENQVELVGTRNGYRIINSFCFENYPEDLENGCPVLFTPNPAVGPDNRVISNFDMNCDRSITYGWRVRKVETVRNYVCEDQACVESFDPNDTRQSCTADSKGEIVPECVQAVCTTQDTCEGKAIEDVTSADVLCETAEDCVKPTHAACVVDACVQVDGAGIDLCTSDADCTISVCTPQETCEPKATTSLIEGEDILCESNADCVVKNVCYNDACVSQRRPGEPNVDECTFDSECQETYLTCEGFACVEKNGDKEDTCLVDEDCYRLVCDDFNEVCIQEEDTSGAADECKNDRDCETPTHLACVNLTCDVVNGDDIDQCLDDDDCARLVCENEACVLIADTSGAADQCLDDDDCRRGDPKDPPPPPPPPVETHLTCVNDACQEVTGSGIDTCRTRDDCVRNVCLNEACVEVTDTSGALDECTSDLDCALPTYQTCVNETCATLSGTAPQGTLLCTSDADCITPPPPAQPTYKTCLDLSCVIVAGTPAAGTQLCDTDAECAAPPIIHEEPVPTTGVEGEAVVITVGTILLLLLGLRLFL